MSCSVHLSWLYYFPYVSFMIKLLASFNFMFKRGNFNTPSDDDDDQYPPQVPVPVSCFVADKWNMKKQIAVMPLNSYLHEIREKNNYKKEEEDQDSTSVCIVCMNWIEGNHEIRVPCNCDHVFHKHCLDEWLDQDKLTCPLCRSYLFPPINLDHATSHHYDPWRFERMLYLFGQDYEFI